MSTKSTTARTTGSAALRGRGLIKTVGAGIAVAGVLATAGCSLSERATTSLAVSLAAPDLPSGDTSNGADNFYTSDRVTVQKVTFKNQYRMNVVGQPVRPQRPGSQRDASGHRRRAPDGRGQGAEREPLRHEDGRAGLRHPVPRPVVLGRERGRAPQRRRCPTSTAEDFSAAVDYLRTQPFVDKERIGAIGICGSGSFVISAAKIDPRIKAIATVSMYDMGAANRDGLRKSVDPRAAQEDARAGRAAARRGVRRR